MQQVLLFAGWNNWQEIKRGARTNCHRDRLLKCSRISLLSVNVALVFGEGIFRTINCTLLHLNILLNCSPLKHSDGRHSDDTSLRGYTFTYSTFRHRLQIINTSRNWLPISAFLCGPQLNFSHKNIDSHVICMHYTITLSYSSEITNTLACFLFWNLFTGSSPLSLMQIKLARPAST